ncbi:MerR family DNA-binding protein [Salinibius halmophilus]|uniref:MerR family DNA-binding protein n=1 Tax=Salinibius halmophilus TaxID=1853216 RepID=UPI000E66FCEC|nr:MerR family DNA-binding protein [Salinibius halmophilus]
MLVSDLAKAAGVTGETVRHYTRKGLIKAQQNPENQYHEYDLQALQRLRFIKRARALGFSLNEIQDIIGLAEHGESPCPTVRDLMAEKIPETERKIAELERHLALMKAALTDWQTQPDGVPTGSSICCLIEDWSQETTDE